MGRIHLYHVYAINNVANYQKTLVNLSSWFVTEILPILPQIHFLLSSKEGTLSP